MQWIDIGKKEKNSLIFFLIILSFFIDIQLSKYISTKLNTVDNYFIKSFSAIASTFSMILLNTVFVIIYYIINPKKYKELYKFISIQIICTIILRFLKFLFGRARPYLLTSLDFQQTFTFFNWDYNFSSFPSGHTFSTWVLIICLTYLFKDSIKKYQIYLLYTYGVAIGISRILLNVHYLSDVLSGAFLGIFIAKNLIRFQYKS